jgi:hypothetical protein
MEAHRLEQKQDLGMKDAEGTQTKFVEGVGWTVTETPQKQALRARQNTEQMAQFADAALRRRQVEENRGRQIKEGDRANALFDEMRKRPDVSTDNIKNILYNKATTGLNRGFDDTAQIAARQALRVGKDPGPIFTELARARGEELGKASAESQAQAMTLAPQIRDQDEKVKANLYNLFATRAQADPAASFQPVSGGDGGLAQAMRGASDTANLSVRAAMQEGGRMPFVPPNYGLANAIGATGTSLQALLRNSGQGTQVSQGSGDLWDQISRRTRESFGAYS